MPDEVVHRDDGLVGGFYQSTFSYGGTEIVSRVDHKLIEASWEPVRIRWAEDIRALRAAGVPDGLPIVKE